MSVFPFGNESVMIPVMRRGKLGEIMLHNKHKKCNFNWQKQHIKNGENGNGIFVADISRSEQFQARQRSVAKRG